jgi:multiple sugar transport system permease protein
MIKSSKVMPYILIFPALCIVGLLTFWPIGYSIYISFTDLYLLRSPIPKFIGLENFRTLFKSNEFLRSLSNSIIWVVGSNICHFGLGLGFALLMNAKFRLKGFFRGIFLIPWVTPVAVVGVLWRWLYNTQWGIINIMLLKWGIVEEAINWLGETNTTMWPSIIASNAWKAYGFMFISILSGLQSIPDELYEAAVMDGANRFQKMIYITLPSIKSLVGTILLLGIAWTFNDITMIWLLTEGGPGFDSSVYGLFVYKNAFQFYRFGLASAGGLVGFVFILILSVIYLRRTQID